MRYVFFMGYVCTANDDGSIPLNSQAVAVPVRVTDAHRKEFVTVNGEFLADLLTRASAAGVETPHGSVAMRTPPVRHVLDDGEDD